VIVRLTRMIRCVLLAVGALAAAGAAVSAQELGTLALIEG
jgi:hypothetical protein